MTTWTPIDSRRAMTAVDADLHLAASRAARRLGQLLLAYPSLTHLLRDHQATGVRAAATDSDGGSSPVPWCFAHEQDYPQCIAEGRAFVRGECVVDPASRRSDPTGNAGTSPDRAAADARALRRAMQRIVATVGDLDRIAGQYPANATRPVDVEAELDDDSMWCESCLRDDDYCEPIALRPGTQTPRFPGLCRWCGEFRGSYGQRPPLTVLKARHRGEKITAGLIDRAFANERRR